MAHFYARIQGARGQASRLGSKSSGISSVTASWQGAVDVDLHHDAETNTDMVHVSLQPWHGAGVSRNLYRGPISGQCDKPSAAVAALVGLAHACNGKLGRNPYGDPDYKQALLAIADAIGYLGDWMDTLEAYAKRFPGGN